MQSLTDGPPIKSEDGTALQQFSIQLTSCINTLREIGYLNKLDNPENLKKIIDRLPFGIRLKWGDAVDRIVEKGRRDVTVKDITDFVTAKARAATHPIFGKVINENRAKQINGEPKRQLGPSANGFETRSDQPFPQVSTKKFKCPLCNANHCRIITLQQVPQAVSRRKEETHQGQETLYKLSVSRPFRAFLPQGHILQGRRMYREAFNLSSPQDHPKRPRQQR